MQEAQRLQLAPVQEVDSDGRKETEEDALVRALIAQEVAVPQADEATLSRFYAANPARFTTPPLYEAETTTAESEDDRIAELIREAALEGAREELPHSLAATVDDREERDDGLLELYASLYVERDSQKGIVIGKGGQRLREVGESARKGIEQLLGRRVYLSLRVKVLKEWQRDPKALGKLGF